ncbi:hypothetical protein BDZ45DRAFT_289671 [Acephala macrosclerotiorum]|nr:hypothetical protein BDZ45DRAFT_289671 [Acephala macrosclerotiorum]
MARHCSRAPLPLVLARLGSSREHFPFPVSLHPTLFGDNHWRFDDHICSVDVIELRFSRCSIDTSPTSYKISRLSFCPQTKRGDINSEYAGFVLFCFTNATKAISILLFTFQLARSISRR